MTAATKTELTDAESKQNETEKAEIKADKAIAHTRTLSVFFSVLLAMALFLCAFNAYLLDVHRTYELVDTVKEDYKWVVLSAYTAIVSVGTLVYLHYKYIELLSKK